MLAVVATEKSQQELSLLCSGPQQLGAEECGQQRKEQEISKRH